MKFKALMKNLLNKFEDLFMKEHKCICCGREIKDGSKFQLCSHCLSEIEIISGNECDVCGDKLDDSTNIKICDRCKNLTYDFDSNKSFCYYTDASAKIVKNLKYNYRKYYAKHIARLMFERKEIFDNIDILTFVPMNRKRKRERSYNQAEEIAIELGRLANIKVKGLLEKIGDGKHQADLSQKDRRENLKGTFCLAEEYKSEIKNKNILIIDDVFTTGSTLHECSGTLKKAKPNKIFCYTFAKTKFNLTKS